MTRTEMIANLVEFSVATAMTESDGVWLSHIFKNGLVGYSKLSDRQLLMEMQMRGLIESQDDLEQDTVDDDDDFDGVGTMPHWLADVSSAISQKG